LQGQPIKARKMQGYKSSANEESAEDKRSTSVDSESKSRSREAEDGRVEAGWDEKISKSCNREGERVDVESTVTESIQSVLPRLGHNSHVTLLCSTTCVRVCPCNNVRKILHYYVPRKELSIVAEFKLEPGCWTCGLDASLTATVRIPKDPGVRSLEASRYGSSIPRLREGYYLL
jgi:hypothetical protein